MLLPILALAVAAPNACLDQTSTVAMVDCFTRQTKQADARLNAAYKAARARVPARQAAALQVAQRAWIAYRTANCRAYALGEGTITQVEHFPAQDLLTVRTTTGDVLVPFVKAIVTAVDIEAGTMTVNPPLGLFEEVDDDEPAAQTE